MYQRQHKTLRNHMKTWYVITILLISCIINASVTQVLHHGAYKFGSNITNSSNNDCNCCMRISSNNVLIDFQGYSITQQDSSSHCSGIIIDENLKNIRIKNVSISNINGPGILVKAGCSEIKLTNVNIINSNDHGLLIDGTAEHNVENIELDSCSIFGTSNDSHPIAGIKISHTSGLQIHKTIVGSTKSNAQDAYGLWLDNCSNAILERLECYNTQGFSTAAGLFINNGVAIRLIAVNAQSNHTHDTSLIAKAYGHLIQSSISISCNYCISSNNTSSNNSYGFALLNGHGNTINECIAQGNSAKNVAIGIYLGEKESNSYIIKSQGLNNQATSSNGIAYGICINGPQNCSITKNNVSSNVGFVGIGLVDSTLNTNNYFAGNFAYANSTAGYDVQFSRGALPIKEATNKDFTSIKSISNYMNILIDHHAPSSSTIETSIVVLPHN